MAMRSNEPVVRREHGTRDRKVLLVITDGIDNASIVHARSDREQASERDTVVFAVGLFGGADRAKDGRHELDRFAERPRRGVLSGRFLNNIGPVALEIAWQIPDQYTIAYTCDQSGARSTHPNSSRVGARTYDRAHPDRVSGDARNPRECSSVHAITPTADKPLEWIGNRTGARFADVESRVQSINPLCRRMASPAAARPARVSVRIQIR